MLCFTTECSSEEPWLASAFIIIINMKRTETEIMVGNPGCQPLTMPFLVLTINHKQFLRNYTKTRGIFLAFKKVPSEILVD